MSSAASVSVAAAPVALFVYNRPDHTKLTLSALQRNELAEETDIFVFCDGPKTETDRNAVSEVRDLIRDLNGFRSVTMRARDENIGLAASIIGGVSEVIEAHGRVIVIEDDLVTHPLTLTYFNRMLDHYAEHAGVFSVSGYTHPQSVMMIPHDYDFDVYAIPRMQCWGWATWKDRWAKADFSLPDFAAFNRSDSAVAAYAHWIGGDSLGTLRECMKGNKDVWACRWVFTHFKHHAVCICPTKSLINNIGMDGTGSNCGTTDVFDQELNVPDIEAWRLPEVVFVEPRIFERFMTVMDRGRARNRIPIEASPSDKLGAGEQSARRKPNLVSRLKYWAGNPAKLIRRIKERISAILARPSIGERDEGQRMEEGHRKVSAEPTVPLVRLGTDYGGWWVPETGIGPDDFVVSAGAGEDISFDVELAKRFGCQIVILDPTPRAITHFHTTCDAIAAGKPASINNSKTEFYRASAEDIARLSFRPWGLWTENTTMRFYSPANPKNVSHSIGNMHQTEEGFDAECVTLSEMLRREGRERISVLKIDIEGAEFAVLDDMIASGLRPRYLLIEFHAGQCDLERRAKPKTIAMLNKLYRHGYRLVKHRGWDYVLERQ